MKKFKITSILLVFVLLANSQIVLENTYQNASFWGADRDFGLTDLGDSLVKYYLIDYYNSSFTLYNLDHSIYKHISIPDNYANGKYRVQYITSSLFDCDSTNVEYMVSFGHPINRLKIYRENNSLIFLRDSTSSVESINKRTIRNTPDGAKMILDFLDGKVEVYDLCGNVMVSIKSIEAQNHEGNLSNPYPNPAIKHVKVEYKLPRNQNQGQIILYSQNGVELQRYNVDNTFNHLIISVNDLPQGAYYYSLVTNNGSIGTKKIIVIK